MGKILFILIFLIPQISFGQSFTTSNLKIDVISNEFLNQLEEKGIDSVIVANYSFNNGRGDQAKIMILWNNDGIGRQKIFQQQSGNKCKVSSIQLCSTFNEIVQFYHRYEEEIRDSEPKYQNPPPSHDYGYCISTNFLFSKIETICARNTVLREDPSHFRSQWIGLIDNVLKKYIE